MKFLGISLSANSPPDLGFRSTNAHGTSRMQQVYAIDAGSASRNIAEQCAGVAAELSSLMVLLKTKIHALTGTVGDATFQAVGHKVHGRDRDHPIIA